MEELDKLIEIYMGANNFLHKSIACDGCPIEACKAFYEDTLKCLKELKAYREAHEEIKSENPSCVHIDGVNLCLDILKERLENADD